MNIKKCLLLRGDREKIEKLSDKRLYIHEEVIPTITERPVKRLRKWHNVNFKYKKIVQSSIMSSKSSSKLVLK